MSDLKNLIINDLINDLDNNVDHNLEFWRSAYKISVEFGSLELFTKMEQRLQPNEIHALNHLEYYTPFFQAIKHGHTEIVHRMYEHADTADRETMLTLYDNHAYSVAIQSGHFELAEWIFERTHEFHLFEEN